MDNGGNDLAHKLSGLALDDPDNKENMFQIMKAVEAAEVAIHQQVEENNRLRSELLKKDHELAKYKLDDLKAQSPYSENIWNGSSPGRPEAHQSTFASTSEIVGDSSIRNSSSHSRGKEVSRNVEDPVIQNNGTLKEIAGSRKMPDNASISQDSSPLTSFPFSRYHIEGEYGPQFKLSAHEPMALADVNRSGSLKQELVVKFREHEEEIMQLRKHLAEYSVKEANLHNQKYVMEEQIAKLRLVFDQQQRELVDAESRAINYRQYIMEENIRLSYALQEAQQERSTFLSSLMPILAENGFQPQVVDAQSIVSSVKVLFKHLREKLIVTEAKLEESKYQIAPWNSDMNPTNYAQSPSHYLGKNGLELVPGPIYANGTSKILSDPVNTSDVDILAHHQSVLGRGTAGNLEVDDFGMYSPIASRNTASQSIPAQSALSPGDSHPQSGETTLNKQVKFSDDVSRIEMDDPDIEGNQFVTDPSANWASENSPYEADDPSPLYSPYLPPVLEEPSSSFSEAADDDPLPAVEGLQISGEAYPGQELKASGYSVNGTTSCNFEWIRHLEDGSVRYIDGAKQPNYLVSADDIDTCLAIEVQPMDDRKRKGELVKVFVNEHRKITCEPEMQNIVKKTLSIGHASYLVSLLVGDNMWEPATLLIKRDSFSIKGTETSISSLSEKFSPATTVSIPCDSPTEFSIIGSSGVDHLLRADDSSSDIACSRDTIVLTLRSFTKKAGEKKKKKGLFFNK